jgi:hypothetical protein
MAEYEGDRARLLGDDPASSAGDQPTQPVESEHGLTRGDHPADPPSAGQVAHFHGELAVPSEIVPTSEGVTRYGGADDWSQRHSGVHTRLDGWQEHPTLDAVRDLIAELRKSGRTEP